MADSNKTEKDIYTENGRRASLLVDLSKGQPGVKSRLKKLTELGFKGRVLISDLCWQVIIEEEEN